MSPLEKEMRDLLQEAIEVLQHPLVHDHSQAAAKLRLNFKRQVRLLIHRVDEAERAERPSQPQWGDFS